MGTFILILLLVAIVWLLWGVSNNAVDLRYEISNLRKDLQQLSKQIEDLNGATPVGLVQTDRAQAGQGQERQAAKLSKPSASVAMASGVEPEDSDPVLARYDETDQDASVNDELPAEKVAVNSASQNTLMGLPKIGSVLAKRIIDARPLGSLDELRNLDGFSDELIEALAPRLIFD